jgi:hypothetical protein
MNSYGEAILAATFLLQFNLYKFSGQKASWIPVCFPMVLWLKMPHPVSRFTIFIPLEFIPCSTRIVQVI